MNIGRNDPCPCGSGKKYKKCCLGKDATPSQALYYQRLSEAHDRLVDRLLPFAEKTFGEDAVDVAMDEFLLWPESEDEIDEDMLDRVQPIFWPWFIFNWEYDAVDADVPLPGPADRTVAELYAEANPGRLDPLEKRLIESINRKPYSFWEVLSVDKGKGMALRDILQGVFADVQERTGSQFVQANDVLFGRVVSIDGVGMFIGLAQTIIPPGQKPTIIQLRKHLQQDGNAINDDTLYEWDTEIRQLYYDIDRFLHTPSQLSNTDGDPMEFHKLIYEISSADEACKKLCDLCVTMTPEEILEEAERDDDGRIVHVEFSWDRHGYKGNTTELTNTVLGNIVINGNRLTAHVNSVERAKTLRRKIDTRLGGIGRFKVDEIQDFDAVMESHEADDAPIMNEKEKDELMQLPEVQEHLKEMIGKHWESWVDQKIPALGGKTPRKAVKNADGREAVEALLQDAVRDRGQDPIMAEANRKGVQRVRESLGLE